MTDPNASDLSWLNLLLCGILLFINGGNLKKETGFLFLVGVGGYVLELIGVKTGILFGQYAYDTALGYKFFEVPIMIAVNWYALVVISSSLVQNIKAKTIYKALLAAFFGVGMDYLIEPVAIKYAFWHWYSVEIPLWNYACWFLALFIFSFVYLKTKTSINKLGTPLFVIWTIFFIILNFV